MASRARGVNAAHTAGIFADMTLDGPEIGTLVAVVDRAKNLPNRKTMGKQDPYCAMRLGKEAKKTDTDKRGGQTPRWDQELRFTVHESPDYYKLKCSVFNDDKKTDLIGEAWLDLHDIIVPGGGQSDEWRQLNFKGKYAGDIRIELTYYDTRPKPETAVETKRQRDKTHPSVNDTTGGAAGPRQLGPREIRRRPLPAGPGGHSSPGPGVSVSELWASEDQYETSVDHGYSNSNPPPRPPKQKYIPETPDDVGYELNPRFGPDSYEPQYDSGPLYHQRQPSNDFHHTYEPSIAPYPEPDVFAEDPYQRRPLPTQPRQPQPLPGLAHSSFSAPQSPYDPVDNHSYPSSPPLQLTPQATPPTAASPQHWNGRASTSPIKYTAYRDSPLRQSVSHTDVPQSMLGFSDPRFDELDEPPPPPPAHRGQISRAPMVTPQFEEPQRHPSSEASAPAPFRGSHGQPTPRTPDKYSLIEEKSPLQKLEHDYDPFQKTPPPVREPQRRLPASEPSGKSPSPDHDRYPLFPTERRKSSTNDLHQHRPRSSADETVSHEQFQKHNSMADWHQESPRDDFRRSTGYAPPQRAQTFDNFDLYDDRHVRRSDPIVVRPRAISPNPNHSIPRKSITPTPTTPDDQKHMSSNPYGPDSYDFLNPGTSPTVGDGAYKSSESLQEAARQKEVDKLRDQGPIIGNDGRVIDPSDHLPSDTWAPEPERKQRKPEHVIKIRTREEARMHRGGGTSPASARPHSIAVSPYQSSTHASASSSYQNSPAAAAPISPQIESPGGRNRLKKPMPQRPLPTEPYKHPQSSPAVPTLPSIEPRPELSSQRYAIHSSPAGNLPQRPAFSEYQLPSAKNFSPRGSTGPAPTREYRSDYMQQTPARPTSGRQPPFETTDYGGGSPFGAESPLALELSSIDIGPSRIGGRTTLRPQKAYGAY
ncbi:hypothetical protein H2200_011441 [Cladophialophora chaetospira]|uniref:C2 domain-containing protein n=1 Tax=Cladophialophora chaetospira TaxID=386627 RepID=A0AA39CD55_9EURO|nr:hypothetical protein H2200_011441 [Cladophialophora chaetospira]